MKPFRLLIKWSVQLDLTQIPINSLAGELQKRPQILIVSAEFLASIEMEVVIAKYLSRCDGRGALKGEVRQKKNIGPKILSDPN